MANNNTTSPRPSSKPHALAIPVPYQGHIHPLMELSKKLASAGFMVTFANTQANHQRILNQRKQENNIKGEPEEGEDLHLVSLEDDLPEEFDSLFGLLLEMLKPEMKSAVARLLTCLNETGPPVSLLVYDFRMTSWLDIAIEAGIPSLALWSQNAANFACNLLVAQEFQLPPDDSTLITCVEGVPPFTRSEISGLYFEQQLSPFQHGYSYLWDSFKRIHEPTWIALNTFKDLEFTTLCTLQERLGFKLLLVGPLVSAASFSIAKGVSEVDGVHSHLKWLHGHHPASVLYIAFGSLATLSEEQLEELICGLEASQVPFLWVFRPDLCQNSRKYTVHSLSRRFENQGLVTSWASQWHILSHPVVGGFLTHCGWNSTLEGITAGVPMLGWPSFIDQPLNMRCIEEQWGIGMGFQVDEGNNKLVSRVEVCKKLRELMEAVKGMEMRERAKTLSRVAKRALKEGGSSHQDLAILYKAMGVLT